MTSHNKPKTFFITWLIIAVAAFIFLGWNAFSVEFRAAPSIEEAENELTAPSESMAENVYLIIVDGLRVDALEVMPFVSKLAEENSYGIIQVEEPTYSRPSYARLITGASSSINGISSNRQVRKLTLPTLFDIAVNSGLTTGASAFHWFYEIAVEAPYSEDKTLENQSLPIQYGYYYGDYVDEVIFSHGKRIMQDYNPHFLIVHPMEVDYLGHAHGGTSEEYLDAAYRNDLYIKDFVESIPDPEESVVIITSDHGMFDYGHFFIGGGHGGTEKEAVEAPIIITGKDVTGNNLEGHTQLDYAPTIAAVLGLPFTAYMEGDIMAAAFDWPEEVKQRKTGLLRDIHNPFVESMYEQYDIDYALEEQASIARLGEKVHANDLVRRTITALIILFAAILILTAFYRKSENYIFRGKSRLIISSVIATAIFFVAHQVSFHYIFDFSYSFSVIGKDIWLFIRLTGPAVIAFLLFFLTYYIGVNKRPEFNSFAFHANFLLTAIIISAITAFVLQGGSHTFLPDFTYYIVCLFTLYHLGWVAVLSFITGRRIIKIANRKHESEQKPLSISR